MNIKTMIALLLVLMVVVVGCQSAQSRYSGASAYQPQNAPAPAGGCGIAAPADALTNAQVAEVRPSF